MADADWRIFSGRVEATLWSRLQRVRILESEIAQSYSVAERITGYGRQQEWRGQDRYH